MPKASAHVGLVLHNASLVDHLHHHPIYHDWIAVVSFYAALHAVETLFAIDQPQGHEHGQSHEEREALLKNERRYEDVYRNYRPLWGVAAIARYLEDTRGRATRPAPDNLRAFKDYMTAEEAVAEAVRHRLYRVLRSVANLLRGKPQASALRSVRDVVQKIGLPSGPENG